MIKKNDVVSLSYSLKNSDGIELGKLIIEASLEEHKWLVDEALILLKKELRKNY